MHTQLEEEGWTEPKPFVSEPAYPLDVAIDAAGGLHVALALPLPADDDNDDPEYVLRHGHVAVSGEWILSHVSDFDERLIPTPRSTSLSTAGSHVDLVWINTRAEVRHARRDLDHPLSSFSTSTLLDDAITLASLASVDSFTEADGVLRVVSAAGVIVVFEASDPSGQSRLSTGGGYRQAILTGGAASPLAPGGTGNCMYLLLANLEDDDSRLYVSTPDPDARDGYDYDEVENRAGTPSHPAGLAVDAQGGLHALYTTNADQLRYAFRADPRCFL
jgi:hypothetical protein